MKGEKEKRGQRISDRGRWRYRRLRSDWDHGFVNFSEAESRSQFEMPLMNRRLFCNYIVKEFHQHTWWLRISFQMNRHRLRWHVGGVEIGHTAAVFCVTGSFKEAIGNPFYCITTSDVYICRYCVKTLRAIYDLLFETLFERAWDQLERSSWMSSKINHSFVSKADGQWYQKHRLQKTKVSTTFNTLFGGLRFVVYSTPSWALLHTLTASYH